MQSRYHANKARSFCTWETSQKIFFYDLNKLILVGPLWCGKLRGAFFPKLLLEWYPYSPFGTKKKAMPCRLINQAHPLSSKREQKTERKCPRAVWKKKGEEKRHKVKPYNHSLKALNRCSSTKPNQEEWEKRPVWKKRESIPICNPG